MGQTGRHNHSESHTPAAEDLQESLTIKLSDYCLADHLQFDDGPRPRFTPVWLLRIPWLLADHKMHFTGLRGAMWRLLGVDRSVKNPNLCNI